MCAQWPSATAVARSRHGYRHAAGVLPRVPPRTGTCPIVACASVQNPRSSAGVCCRRLPPTATVGVMWNAPFCARTVPGRSSGGRTAGGRQRCQCNPVRASSVLPLGHVCRKPRACLPCQTPTGTTHPRCSLACWVPPRAASRRPTNTTTQQHNWSICMEYGPTQQFTFFRWEPAPILVWL
jgi:hypothetical protein